MAANEEATDSGSVRLIGYFRACKQWQRMKGPPIPAPYGYLLSEFTVYYNNVYSMDVKLPSYGKIYSRDAKSSSKIDFINVNNVRTIQLCIGA